MKELYENAEMDVINIDAADVIRTSSALPSPVCPYEDRSEGDAFL